MNFSSKFFVFRLGGAVVVALYAKGFPSSYNVGVRKTNASSNGEGFIVTPYMKILEQIMLIDNDNTVDKFRGVFGVKVKKDNGEEGYWVINTKTGKGTVEFNSKGNFFFKLQFGCDI